MSARHPIIAIIGSSGTGTGTVTRTFQHIFRREGLNPAIVEGNAFRRHDRAEMKAVMAREAAAGNPHFSHFGPDASLFEALETLFRQYGADGTGRSRIYLHDEEKAAPHGRPPGTFTPWEDIAPGTDILFYEGLHGAVKTDRVDVGRYADLRIGVVPTINLEWIQKLHRDREQRGHAPETVTRTILRRMPDYVHYICPQFEHTHINFQRVPMVDTSNPFIARAVPTPEESMIVIRFANPRGIDFQYLLSMLRGAFMSRANTIAVPGGKMELAMQLIFTPLILRLVENGRKARARG
jgi:phosphoribulokinase